ncbi:MAG: flagellar M-ring protein FliF [Deltaproteobacteria bacterium HGW-Deltaproteobacteria-7]|jgi:flagellar M-ring protein FliF|nr:MAG: flagellar M-ring protein FliF [Deltaproteobacteria bacterium HGW-Deltaproteobacteria-7]PKN20797.1 MAG: flagellar M-ring protein FliF [Deltaproteobacteria bacterium HGW-Deltaproteobacteria-6]
MDSIFQSLSKFWSGFDALSSGKKISIIMVLLVTAASIVLLVYLTTQIEYRVLFSNLSSEDAGHIVSKLSEKKIPYKVSSSGGAISVPAEKVSELRLELAAAGLPQGGGVGFEIFDNKTLGATEFEQQLNYRRALQGELSRTINGLDEIQSSRVHIALPKDSIFTEQQKKPTASVTLRLKSGKGLRPAQIDGIVHLVASSIEGMNPEDVMVVDSRGAILSVKQNDNKLSKLTAQQSDYQRNMEKDLAARIQSMLENVVGQGKAAVRVTAELDFRIMEKTEESYNPEAQVVRSTQRNSEKENAVTTAGAVSDNPKKEKLDEIINYEINKVVSKTVMPVGETKKLSIAVLVDGKYKKNEKNEEVYQALTKNEIESLEDLVRKSAGINTQRGDQVVVTNMPFRRVEAEESESATLKENIETFSPVLKYIGIFGLIAFIVLFVLRPLLKSVMSGAPVRPMAQAPLPAGGAAAEYARQAAEIMHPTGSDQIMTEAEMTKEMARADAKQFADILRNWIK